VRTVGVRKSARFLKESLETGARNPPICGKEDKEKRKCPSKTKRKEDKNSRMQGHAGRGGCRSLRKPLAIWTRKNRHAGTVESLPWPDPEAGERGGKGIAWDECTVGKAGRNGTEKTATLLEPEKKKTNHGDQEISGRIMTKNSKGTKTPIEADATGE